MNLMVVKACLGVELGEFGFGCLWSQEALTLSNHAQKDLFYKSALVFGLDSMRGQGTKLALVRNNATSSLGLALIVP